MDDWSGEELQRFDAAVELEIAVRRPDGDLRGWTPVWVVCVGEDVFVRSWYRRETGWFGRAVAAGRARVRVPGLEADVAVVDLGAAADRGQDNEPLFGEIDAAYRSKYGRAAAGSMVSAQARPTTLRLDRL